MVDNGRETCLQIALGPLMLQYYHYDSLYAVNRLRCVEYFIRKSIRNRRVAELERQTSFQALDCSNGIPLEPALSTRS